MRRSRTLIGVTMGTIAAIAAFPAAAQTAGYPARQIHVISSQAVGGGVDALTRVVGQALQEKGQPGFSVEARPGANGVLAVNGCAAAKPDGYTVCLVNPQFNFVPLIFSKSPYDPTKFEPVTLIVNSPYAFGLQKSVPAKNLTELIAYSKANPGKLNFVSLGNAHPVDLAVERLMSEWGVKWTPIPYKGANDSMAAFAQGDVHVMFITTPNVATSVQGGHGSALFVTSKRRVANLANVPTLEELGRPVAGAEGLWFGLIAPPGTPRDLMTKLAADIAGVLKQPAIAARAETLGFELVANTPDEFGRVLSSERAKATEMLKDRPKIN